MRYAVGGLGVVLGLWGVWLIFGTADVADFVNIGVWVGAGIVAHDVLIAGITVGVAAWATRVLPAAAKAPATVGLVVVGTISVVAIPFLGRFGARPDNATLLDRNYLAGYLLIVGLTVISVVVASIVRARQGAGAPAS